MVACMERWQSHIMAGNDCLADRQLWAAIAHYQRAIAEAEQLLDEECDAKAAVTALVVSYHNLADLYSREAEPKLAEGQLRKVHEFVLSAMRHNGNNQAMAQALNWGVTKTYQALVEHYRQYGDGQDCLVPFPTSSQSLH